MFTEAFMQRALLAALAMGPLCALLGVFVTARRMAFFSDTISHAALAGVALGFWLGMTDPTGPMVVFSLLVAVGILWLKENTELLTDTIMALLLSGSVALGILIFSLLKGYRGELFQFLFGDILAISAKEVISAYLLLAAVAVWFFWKLSALTLVTAQEEMASVCGVGVRRLNFIFVLVLTLSVAASIRLLGVILVTSLLVIPPAAARNISRNLRQQIVLSLGAGVVGAAGGTVLAYEFNAPCGPMIVLSCIVLFLVTLAGGRLRPARLAAKV